MFNFISLHVAGEETLINVSHIVQIKHPSKLCEVITVNGAIRPDESYDEVLIALKGLFRPRPL